MSKQNKLKNFLEIYGWALLSALIVIGILVYYYYDSEMGIFITDPTNYTCYGEQFCNSLDLELYNIDGIYSNQIVCETKPTDYSKILTTIYITNKTQLINQFKDCESEGEKD